MTIAIPSDKKRKAQNHSTLKEESGINEDLTSIKRILSWEPRDSFKVGLEKLANRKSNLSLQKSSEK
jgi:hypothetical protein